jgi:hypothetical protein
MLKFKLYYLQDVQGHKVPAENIVHWHRTRKAALDHAGSFTEADGLALVKVSAVEGEISTSRELRDLLNWRPEAPTPEVAELLSKDARNAATAQT